MSMFSCYETKPINGVKITSLKRNRTIRGNLNLLDNKFENYEIARMNLENILVNFPKRTDIWNVYLDMEIKYTKNQKYIRDLFNKFILLPHKIKKAKKTSKEQKEE